MQVTVAFDWRDTTQQAKGRWIEECLRVAGLRARHWSPVGGNWVTGLDEAAVSEEPCFLVFTPDMDPAGPTTMLWQAVKARGSQRPMVPILFDDAKPPVLLGANVPIRIEVNDTGDVAQRKVADAIEALGLLSEADRTGIANQSMALTIDHSGDLPRLRQLTQLSLAAASAVGQKSFGPQANSDGTHLYIRRDIQDMVSAQLHSEGLTVVAGHAGTGKTSLLWGVACELLSANDNEVFFIRAAMFTGRADRAPLVTPEKLRGALRQCSRMGTRAFVLIDTADVLVGDDDGYLTLMEIVDLVGDEHGSVLLTSRPAEAGVITAGRKAPIELRSYSLNPGPHDRLGEFDRAVASHATAYCQSPGDTSALASQIRAAVIRQQSLGDIARRPLTLRMLFELYAPATVPETIDATKLFERYWVDRVYRDRRSWTPTGDKPDTDTDLTPTAMRIARQMLRDGVPEVAISDINRDGPAASIQLEHDVDKLCARGIGQRDELGTFKFFHQTFFEFTAAKDLLEHGPPALDMIIERAHQRPEDYFLQSVVEQAWICAWHHNDQFRQHAASVTSQVLSTAQDDVRTTPFILRRCALIVAAQSPIDPATREVIGAALRDRVTESAIVRDFLSHVPRPGRPWGAGDTDIVTACCQRADASWHAAIEVLARLARSQPQEALAALTTLAGQTLPVGVISPTTLIRKPTRDMLSVLLPGHTNEVLTLLSDAMAADASLRRNTLLEKIFDMLDTASDSATDIARWADMTQSVQTASTALLEKSGRLHKRAVAGMLDSTDGSDDIARLLLIKFSANLETIATSSSKQPPVSAAAFCWGMLAALSEPASAGISPKSRDALVRAALELLVARYEPRVHEQIHQGWLVGLVSSNPAVRQWAARTLIDGLPASHRDPQTPRQRWADTVRRVLERSDADRNALIAVITQFAAAPLGPQHNIQEIWTHPDLLLRLLLPAACAEFTDAQTVLAAIIDGTVILDDRQVRILVQQAQRLKPADAANGNIIELLTIRGEYEELKQLCMRNPDARWTAEIATSTRDSAMRDALSGQLRRRRSATGFLKQATSSGVIPYPEHQTIADTTMRSRDPVVRADLAEISSEAVNQGLFPADAVIAMLRKRLVLAITAGHLNRDHEATVMRRTLVGLLGLHGNENDIDEALSLAFLPDVETNTVVALAGFLIPQRRSHSIPIRTTVELVAEVGTRFTTVSRASRDVAGAWRPIFSQLLNHADDDALLALIAQLPRMAPLYAAVLIGRLPHRRGSSISTALAETASSSSVAAEVKRAIALHLDRVGGPSAGWLDLDQDLLALADTSRTSVRSPQF